MSVRRSWSWQYPISVALGAVLATAGVGGATPALAAPVPSPTEVVAAAEQAFAVGLLQHLGPGAGNVVMSPSSLAVLLAMLEPGAAGATEEGIAAALHSSSLSALAQASGWHALDTRLLAGTTAKGAKGAKVELEVANQAWLQDGLPVKAPYLRLLASDFAAGVQEQDIAHDPAGAAQAIDNWVSRHTGGHIKRLLNAGQLDHIVAVLVDAVYFNAAWKYPFDPSLTAPRTFHISPSQTTKVPMMTTDEPMDVPVRVTGSLSAAELPYKGGHFQALVVMPALGTLASYEADLSPAKLNALFDGLKAQRADISLPRADLNSNLHLEQVLSAMGMATAFSNNADFSNLSPEPVKIGFVVQDAQVQVDERGTEASAASGAGLRPTAVEAPPPVSVVFNHPYLFLVRDPSTGTVLFEAQVTDPALG